VIIPIERIKKEYKWGKSQGLRKKKRENISDDAFQRILENNRIMMLKNKRKVNQFMDRLR